MHEHISTYGNARSACRYVQDFRSWKTSTLLIRALHFGAKAWIRGRVIPDAVEELKLPNSTPGKLVHRAYVEQTSLGWNLLFRGFWSISWRKAQEYEFSHGPFHRGHTDNGESWARRAQTWMFYLFDLAWGLRNADVYGVDLETQRMIRLAKCERAIRRLYHSGESLSLHERHPFRDQMEALLSKSVTDQERWLSMIEAYLPVAKRRIKRQEKQNQRPIKECFGWSRST
jgi:hypothetical protein